MYDDSEKTPQRRLVKAASLQPIEDEENLFPSLEEVSESEESKSAFNSDEDLEPVVNMDGELVTPKRLQRNRASNDNNNFKENFDMQGKEYSQMPTTYATAKLTWERRVTTSNLRFVTHQRDEQLKLMQ